MRTTACMLLGLAIAILTLRAWSVPGMAWPKGLHRSSAAISDGAHSSAAMWRPVSSFFWRD